MKITLLLSLIIVFYTFAGYGILLYFIIRVKRLFKGIKTVAEDLDNLPTCTLVVAAYNEESFMKDKIANTLSLNYPTQKLNLLFITDGSSDNTPNIISQYSQIQLMHQPQRAGKIAAIHRAMEFVHTDAVVFTDANTFLNKDALIKICRHYSDATVGAVAGEKRVHFDENADASAPVTDHLLMVFKVVCRNFKPVQGSDFICFNILI